MIHSYNNILEVIEQLEASETRYLILRNYDNLLNDALYMNGHGDIDILCENSLKLAKSLNATPDPNHIKNGKHDGVHFYIFIAGERVSLDLRFVGDGYYCSKWQKDMLQRRVLFHSFYVMNKEDYFYSLIYHAIFQKEMLTEEYKNRLLSMAHDLDIKLHDDKIKTFVMELEQYMIKHNYIYIYPKDYYVSLNTKYIVNSSLLHFEFNKWLKHNKFILKVCIIKVLVQLKHLLIRKVQ